MQGKRGILTDMKTKNQNELPFFGRKLKVLREARGLNQAELARALGVSRETVSYYEVRASNPTAELVSKVAAFFNVEPGELISEESQRKSSKPGPASKLEMQLDKIQKLPPKKQKVVSEMLDMLLAH